MSSWTPRKCIDFHVHVFPDDVAPKALAKFVKLYGIKPYSDGTVAGTLACMDEAGIDICVPQMVALIPSQVSKINDWAASFRSDRIIPFGSMHPDFSNAQSEINRLIDMGFPGIKFQPDWQSFYPNDEKVFPIYEAVEEHLAVMFHVDRSGNPDSHAFARRLLKVRQKFPGLTMIAAHMGGGQHLEACDDNLVGTDIYFDTSRCFGEKLSDEDMTKLIQRHSANKILFASDLPFASPNQAFQHMANLPISVEDKENIAWRNAAKILNIE